MQRKGTQYLSYIIMLLLSSALLLGAVGADRAEAAGKPSITLTKRAKKSATIKIKKQNNVTGYQVFVKIGKNGKYKHVMSTLKPTYKITGLKANKVYYVRVRSYRTRGYRISMGKYSNVVKIGKYTKPVPDKDKEEEPSETQEPSVSVEQYLQEVLRLVNVEREKEGIAPLTLDTQLCAAAGQRAEELAESFAHVRPDGSNVGTVLEENGCQYTKMGENIAAGQATPEEVVASWMDSQGHRENILNPDYAKLGVGYYEDDEDSYKYYWVQLFTD